MKLVLPLIVTILLIGTFTLIFQQDAEAAIKPEITTKNLKLNSNEFMLPTSRYDQVEVKISGFIDDYKRGIAVDLEVTNPNGEIEKHKLRAADGNYIDTIFVQSNFPIGTYHIKITYLNEVVDGITFLVKDDKDESISQIPEKTPTAPKQAIPDWFKNNAGWWADGLITEDDFVKGIQYLVEQGIIKV